MIFKFTKIVTCLTVSVALSGGALAQPVDDLSSSPFFSDSALNGSFSVHFRDRTRGNVDTSGNDTPETVGLDHGTLIGTLGFSSGYIADSVGLDLSGHASFDMYNEGSPDHEMNFWGVDNPYDMNPDSGTNCSGAWETDCTDNGVALHKSALKFKFGNSVRAQVGMFQPSVASSLGVNWGVAPGSYLGGEIGAKFGLLELGAVYATEYKAPWFKESYGFRQTDNLTDGGDVYSVGARYNINSDYLLDVGYTGLTDGDRKNAHIKLKSNVSDWYISPQAYFVEDDEMYESTAMQFALLSSTAVGDSGTLRLETTYTIADSGNDTSVGNLAYRITSAYGGSNGAYDVWWNNRSDFNHDGELGLFAAYSRDFTSIGIPGFSLGVSGVYAFGAKAEGYDELVEYSVSGSANYIVQSGSLAGGNVGLYVTKYTNDSNAPNWQGYSNAFQNETDVKLSFMLPFTLK